jgi:hypothetical protein
MRPVSDDETQVTHRDEPLRNLSSLILRQRYERRDTIASAHWPGGQASGTQPPGCR